MEKFEYAYISKEKFAKPVVWTMRINNKREQLINLENCTTIEALNKLGAEGWEVILKEDSVDTYLLKRKLS